MTQNTRNTLQRFDYTVAHVESNIHVIYIKENDIFNVHIYYDLNINRIPKINPKS